MKTFGTAKNTINLCAMFAFWSLSAIPALGQSGGEEISWGFEVLEDGTAAVYYESGALDKTIEVPTTIDSYVVTTIRVGAFSNNVALTGISIPNTVTNIDDYAFYGCTGLTELILDSGLRRIGEAAFLGCTGLPDVVLPSGVEYIGDQAFDGGHGLSLETPGVGVYVPGSLAFYLDMQPVSLTSEGRIALGEGADPEVADDGSIRLPHLISLREADEGVQLPGVAEVRGTDGEAVAAEVVFTPASGALEIRTTKDGQPEEGVAVWIDNAVEPLGVTPLTVTNLAAAKHILLLRKEGFLRPRPVEFTVTEDSVLAIEIPLATDDRPAMEINVESALPEVDIYVDYLPTGEKTPHVVGGMDPAFHGGGGWSSTSHSILLRHELLTPYAPRMVPEWELAPGTGVPVVPGEPAAIRVAAPNDSEDSDGDGLANVFEAENGWNPFVPDNNVLVGHAGNGETIAIRPGKESGGLFFTALEPGKGEGTLQAGVAGDVSGSGGTVVESGLYLVMKRALVGEGSDQVFACPCVGEVFNPSSVFVTWEIPDAAGPFFVMGLCGETEAEKLGGWKTPQIGAGVPSSLLVEWRRASCDAQGATTKTLPMALVNDSSKSYLFKTDFAGVYGFEVVEFTQEIKSVNMKIVNKDINKTIKVLSGCKVGSHIAIALEPDSNFELVVSRNSGKKGAAYIKLGLPAKSEDFTDFVKSEEADILEINDSVVFAGQKNVYTFTAEKNGVYAFVLGNAVPDRVRFSVVSEGIPLNAGTAGQGDCFTQELEAGKSYAVTIQQISGRGKYTLALHRPKDTIDLGTFKEVTDSLEYKTQQNVYAFTPPVAGPYGFGISVPDNADGQKHVTLALYEDGRLCQISEAGEAFTCDLKANVAYAIVVSYVNTLTPYTLEVVYP